MTTALMGRPAMIAVPSPVNLCALTIIPPASLYMTLAHEYASREPNPEPKPQTPSPNPKPQTRTQTRTQTQTRSPNRPHRIGSALGMGAEGSSAGGKGGMNPSKGEGSIPRCSLYRQVERRVCSERPEIETEIEAHRTLVPLHHRPSPIQTWMSGVIS